MLKEIMASDYPVILYESKHRILKLLAELEKMSEVSGEKRQVMVARELTKLYESFYAGTPTEILADLQQDPNCLKGEFVVLIQKLRIKK